MIVRCVCLGLLITTLSGCNRAMDDVRVDNIPISAYQDQHILFPLLQLQLDQEIRARLDGLIAENLSKDIAVPEPDIPINTELITYPDDLNHFDLLGHMALQCKGLCEDAQLKGITTITIDLDNRYFALQHIALTDDKDAVTLTGSISQFLYGIDHSQALADANLILRTLDGHIEIDQKATLLMIESPLTSVDTARGQIEISHISSNTFLWGHYFSVNP